MPTQINLEVFPEFQILLYIFRLVLILEHLFAGLAIFYHSAFEETEKLDFYSVYNWIFFFTTTFHTIVHFSIKTLIKQKNLLTSRRPKNPYSIC